MRRLRLLPRATPSGVRGQDCGTLQIFLRAEATRINCSAHKIVVTRVPWARHGSRFTKYIEDLTACLKVETSRKMVADPFLRSRLQTSPRQKDPASLG